MTLNGALSVDFDVKSPADKFFEAFVEHTTRNQTVSVAMIIVGPGKLEFESVDWVKRIITVKMNVVQNSRRYKTLKGIITVTPKENGGGSNVVWTVEFEKISTDIGEPPFLLVNQISRHLTKIDDKLLK